MMAIKKNLIVEIKEALNHNNANNLKILKWP